MQDKLIAGDTLNYRSDVAGYSATDGWAFKLRLVPRAGAASAVEITGVQDGDDWLVRVPASTTSIWTAGDYGWAAWVEKAGEVYTIETGQISVLPNPRSMAPGADSRSVAELALANIQAVLQGRATAAVESYTINGRQLKYYPLADLLRLESKYKTDVDRERVAAGLPSLHGSGIRRILVRAI